MMSKWVIVCGLVALCSACSGSEGTTSGGAPGGSAGSSGGAGNATGGSSGSSTASMSGGTAGTSAGGSGGSGGCSAPAMNVYDNAAESGVPDCDHPIAPLPNEDGTFAVTVFGPFATPFNLTGISFAALDSADLKTAITDPWTAAVIVVPAGSDPLAVNPSETAKAYPLSLIEKLTIPKGTVNRYSISLDMPLSVGACDSVVVALRNTVGPPSSALSMCGAGSSHPETNQWWNLDNTMSVMQSYGPGFDRDWWVSLVPGAPK